MSLQMSHSNESVRSAFKPHLRAGEEILWAGDAVPFTLFQGTDGAKVRNKMLGSILGMGAFLGLYLAVAPEISTNLVLIILALLAVMLITPVTACKTLNARRYAITNQRVLVLKGDWLQAEMALPAVDNVTCYETNEAHSLALGQPIQEESDRQLRWRAMHPFGGDHGSYDGMVLYAIPDAMAALDILRTRACKKAA